MCCKNTHIHIPKEFCIEEYYNTITLTVGSQKRDHYGLSAHLPDFNFLLRTNAYLKEPQLVQALTAKINRDFPLSSKPI